MEIGSGKEMWRTVPSEGREPAEGSHRAPKGAASCCSTETNRGVHVSEDWRVRGDFTLNPGHRGMGWGSGTEVSEVAGPWVATTLWVARPSSDTAPCPSLCMFPAGLSVLFPESYPLTHCCSLYCLPHHPDRQ